MGEAGGERTEELSRPRRSERSQQAPDERPTATLTEGREAPPGRAGGIRDLVRDFTGSVGRSFSGGGWWDLTGAAAFGFLAFVAVGALLAIAAKLQYADLGAGADPLAILSAIVMAGLGVLRVPIAIGGVTVSALPLGGLLLAGFALAWATGRAVRRRGLTELQAGLLHGAKVAVPFAVICWLAALIFRIRTDPSPVAAQALPALVLGAIWGMVFGVAGALMWSPALRAELRAELAKIKDRWRSLAEGVVAGGLMVVATLVLGALAALLWIIVGLATGRPAGDFGAADGLAAFIYMVLFAPNVVTAITAVALGARVEVGAQVTEAGEVVGRIHEISIWSWAGEPAPWFLFLLVFIPLLACLLGGFAARRATKDPSKVIEVLVAAAFTYAIVLFELAALSEARLGAGLVREQGFGLVAPVPGLVLLAALLWALLAGYGGWRLAESGAGD